ncbi:diguanylate cyclase domain-containing protein [Oceanospirillum beijerinckii]|uniref:diguanylate cyclase domain-containing protein n=1 Tax=Oceanospirillum beijerinckii TaxID=64976 RepID=UPI0003FF44C5|nr:diguanylate cyclase [Oceanospirillum beijerinckii]
MKDISTRYWLLLILALGIFLSTGSAWLLHFSERAQLNNRLAKDVADRAAGVDREVTASLEALYTLQALFVGRDLVSHEDFVLLSRQTRRRHPDIKAFYWIEQIAANERSHFGAQSQQLLKQEGFQIRRFNAEGHVVKSEDHAFYRPVFYMEPDGAELLPLGLDLSLNTELNPLLSRAAISGDLMLSAGKMAGKGSDSRTLLQAVLPVYQRVNSTKVRGFILAVIDVGAIFEHSLTDIRIAGIDMNLLDITDPTNPMLLHFHPSRTRLPVDHGRAIYHSLNPIGHRLWELQAVPTFYYFNSKRTWLPQLVFLFGMASTLLIMRLFISFAKKNEKMQIQSRELMTSNQELEEISRTDALTGIANRRYFDEVLAKEWKRAIRNQTPLTLIMVDVDCFKMYNDYYGHLEGDECIRKVAQTLKEMMCRPMDLVARYGGEEFAILLPDTNNNAVRLAEQCRRSLAEKQIPHAASKVSPYVTISSGMATLKPDVSTDISELVRQADRALYKAKEKGRNQVCTAQELTESADDPKS